MSIYKQIKKAVSVKEAAERYGLSVTRNGMVRCPFHEDHSPSLKLNEDYYYCFGCHATGDVIDFTSKLLQLCKHHAAKQLAADFGIHVNDSETEQKPAALPEIPENPKLFWREQTILKARNAICSNCGGMRPRKEHFQFQEIGKRIMKGATDKGAEAAYHAALDRLAAQLIEDGSCRIVDLSLESLEQAENKNTAATYLYRVDCDGEWGEIHFDFENKRIKIQRLAEWDTIRSHKYAWKVISLIALKGNTVLPQKKRLIFWDKRIGQKKKRVLLQDGSVIYLPRPRWCSSAPKIFSKSSSLHCTTYTRTAGFCLRDKSRISAHGAPKIRLFCSHWKGCVLQANIPFPASAVAKGITH